jgi:hypothetical protein
MRFFSGKTILIISPQEWSKMKISKHHYAIELKKMGNEVFFLNPSSKKVKPGECKLSFISDEGIKVIDYRPIFPMRFKFKFNSLYNLLIQLDIRRILKFIGKKIDVVWDFEPNRQFPDLSKFKAGYKIYHPVDMTKHINSSTKNADIVLSVSDVILDLFNSNTPKYFINHGLNSIFSDFAKSYNNENLKQKDKVDIGYIGNLKMPVLNHSLIMALISAFPNCQFHFWGPHEKSASEHMSVEVESFLNSLKNSENVILHGTRTSAELLDQSKNIDVFFWALDNDKDPSKGSNSHKILEYLSLGRIIVGTTISKYQGINQELICMSDEKEYFIKNLSKIIMNLSYYNSPELVAQRMLMALENTYESQIGKIDKIISDQLQLNLQ